MHPFFHYSPFSPFFCGQLFLCCLLEGGVWRMGPFLPNCIFEGFFSLVHASLKIHLFYKALWFFLSQEMTEDSASKFHQIQIISQNAISNNALFGFENRTWLGSLIDVLVYPIALLLFMPENSFSILRLGT